MIITFVGISGCGKSYWSKKLEKKGFTRICCDDLIEEKLGNELKKLGYKGICEVALWMGQPYQRKYRETSKKYIQYEIEVMNEIIEKTVSIIPQNNIIIDTTGSLIYTNEIILNTLVKRTKLVYLHTPHMVKRHMFELFIREPKPIIWGNSFYRQKDESPQEAIKRCYKKLLSFRTNKYKKIAEIILDYHLLRHESFSEDVLLDIVSRYD